jgi:hypothetical protein
MTTLALFLFLSLGNAIVDFTILFVYSLPLRVMRDVLPVLYNLLKES